MFTRDHAAPRRASTHGRGKCTVNDVQLIAHVTDGGYSTFIGGNLHTFLATESTPAPDYLVKVTRVCTVTNLEARERKAASNVYQGGRPGWWSIRLSVWCHDRKFQYQKNVSVTPVSRENGLETLRPTLRLIGENQVRYGSKSCVGTPSAS